MTCGVCGHDKSDHARQRGVCLTCYEHSDHGQRTYCPRWRRPQAVKK